MPGFCLNRDKLRKLHIISHLREIRVLRVRVLRRARNLRKRDSGVMARKLVTSGQLAEELGINNRTVSRYVRQGLLVPTETTIGGHHRWDIDDVREQIRKLREQGQ